MDCLRRKNQKKRERDHKKHHVSPNHSQPSTINTTVNSTLPKASSTGLWIDKPGMYAVHSPVAPPQSYYYGRPHGYRMPNTDYAYHMPRAVSETRIPQPGSPYAPYRHQFGSQSNVFLLPVPGQRFYHSQQLAPVYELPPTRGMEIYDYPYAGVNGGFRSKLIETRHTPDYYTNTSEFILRPRVERSKSDAEERKEAKSQARKEQPKDIVSAAENGQSLVLNESKNGRAFFKDEEKQVLKSSGGYRATHENVHGAHVNNVFSANSLPTAGSSVSPKVQNSKALSYEKVSTAVISAGVQSSENMPSSATDSMKILAKNKTDDQKTKPTFSHVDVDNNANRMDENDREYNVKHYKYEGSIYTLPEKRTGNNDCDNPIISRMKEMVIERSQSSKNDWNNVPQSTSRNSGIHTSALQYDMFNEDVTKVTKVTKTKVIESLTTGSVPGTGQQTNTFSSVIDGLVLPDILVPDEETYNGPSPRVVVQKSDERPIVASKEERNGQKESSKPATERVDGFHTKGSVDIDDNSDDLNRAGKQLATSAFQFLDNYLSDDEGTESLVESPPLSPGLRAGQVY